MKKRQTRKKDLIDEGVVGGDDTMTDATKTTDVMDNEDGKDTKTTTISTITSSIHQILLQIYFYFYTFISFGIYSKIDRGPAFSNSILILGDDFAFGVGDTPGFMTRPGIAKYLVRKLFYKKEIRQTWNVYSEGRVKSTTRDWVGSPLQNDEIGTSLPGGIPNNEGYLSQILSKKVYSDESCKIVILFLGYNDGRNGITPSETITNLKLIIQSLLSLNKKVFLTTIPTLDDHLVNETLYGDNLERNSSITKLISELGIFSGPDISFSNFEYKGKHLWKDGYLNQRGYEKVAKDYGDLIVNEMVKVEFAKFRVILGMK